MIRFEYRETRRSLKPSLLRSNQWNIIRLLLNTNSEHWQQSLQDKKIAKQLCEIYEEKYLIKFHYISRMFSTFYEIYHFRYLKPSKIRRCNRKHIKQIFSLLHRDLRLIVHHEYLDARGQRQWGKREEREKKKQAIFYAVDAFFREYRVAKNLRAKDMDAFTIA